MKDKALVSLRTPSLGSTVAFQPLEDIGSQHSSAGPFLRGREGREEYAGTSAITQTLKNGGASVTASFIYNEARA